MVTVTIYDAEQYTFAKKTLLLITHTNAVTDTFPTSKGTRLTWLKNIYYINGQ